MKEADELLNHPTVYASPRVITNLDDCFFYHTMDVPGYGCIPGQWDLRPGVREYLGGVDFSGKRVLELGTADGFFCFHMEKEGADVVAYDLSDQQTWDVVPFAGDDMASFFESRRVRIRQLNNAFWLSHGAFHSQAKAVYGSVYAVPREIGPVDISTFGSILLHVRDPFLALENALRLTRETVIVTEPVWRQSLLRQWVTRYVVNRLLGPFMVFAPNPVTREPKETWWTLPPAIIQKYIGVLGFEKSSVFYHAQRYEESQDPRPIPYYTIVGQRTRAMNGS